MGKTAILGSIGAAAALAALLGLRALKGRKARPAAAAVAAPAPSGAAAAAAIAPSLVGEARRTWSAGTAVVLTPTVEAFLDDLQAELGDAFPLFATSGKRDPESQARALKTKRDRGEDLTKLYQQKDLINEVLAAANTIEDMARVIAAQVARGKYLSRHLRDDAVDLRSRDLTPAQVDQVVAAARTLGAKPLIESDHIHIEAIKA